MAEQMFARTQLCTHVACTQVAHVAAALYACCMFAQEPVDVEVRILGRVQDDAQCQKQRLGTTLFCAQPIAKHT